MSQKRNDEYVDIYSSSKLKKSSTKKGDIRIYKTSAGKKFSNVLISILCVVLAIGGSAMIYGNSILASMYTPETTTASSTADDEYADASITNNIVKDPMVLNIMVFGSDKRPDQDNNGNSDSMILLSIDNRHHKLKLTSFMRDTYVYIPGYYNTKLNAAYSLGGPSLSIETVERNFGVDIDRYVVLYFDTFPAVIDTLGGVNVTIDDDEAGYLYHDFPYREPSFYNGAGDYMLDGEEALDYARMRHVGNNDFERTERQRKLIDSLVAKFQNSDVETLTKLMTQFLPEVSTNITVDEMTSLAEDSTKYLNYPISEFRLPTDDNYHDETITDVGATLVIDDIYQAREDLARFIYEETVDPIYGSSSSETISSSTTSSSSKSSTSKY